MTWVDVRLAIGEFLTSAGFAGLMALTAAIIAYKGIGRRIAADRDMAEAKATSDRDLSHEQDEAERWWQAVTWLWANYTSMTDEAILDMIESLEASSTSPAQSAMLEGVMDGIFKNGGGAGV